VHIQFDRLHAVLAEIDVDCLHHHHRAFGRRAHQDLHDERHALVPCLPCPGPYSECRWWRLGEKDENLVTDNLEILGLCDPLQGPGDIAVHIDEHKLWAHLRRKS